MKPVGLGLGGARAEDNSSSPRSPQAVINVSSDDLSQNAHLREGRSDNAAALDSDKAGAALLFSGIFLGLMGMTFTAMGWLNYDDGEVFEWTQLLGPILLSVGGTFMLISVCKFGMLPCLPCRQRRADEDDAMPERLEHIPTFVFNAGGQPMMFHGATVVQYSVPPPYAAVSQGARPAAAELNCSPGSPPQYHTVCPRDNPAFTRDEGSSARVIATHHRASRAQETADEYQERHKDDNNTTRPLPPAYDDLFPSAVRQHDLNAT